VDQSAGDTGNEQSIVNLQFDCVFQRLAHGLEHGVESFGLCDSSWETIENEAVAGQSAERPATEREDCLPIGAFPVCVQLILDHVDHDIVTDQASLVHDLFRFPTKGRLFGDLCPQHVTGGLN
jgi:hypothetical protein